MMGGPIDARKSPTAVNNLAMNKSYDWFENNVIYRVPTNFAGAGRRVYPGFLQHSGFVAMNPSNHAKSHYDYFKDLIKGDDAKGADLIALVRDALATAKASCKEGASAYVCFPWRTYSEFEDAMLSCGMAINSCIVWDKKSVGLGHQDYRPQHEFIFYSKGGQFYGDRSQSDVWYMSRGSTAAYVHPTQKPVELVEKAIENSSKKGDAVVDCFGGSGSTLIACEKTGRHGRLMELDPKYCDVIVKRYIDFTGKNAILESSGKTFDEVKHEKSL